MERRVFERVYLPIKLSYEVKARPKVTKESKIKNISGNGICLSLKEKLLPTAELTIHINIGSRNDNVTLRGKVVWTRRVEVVGDMGPLVYYDTGIELINADPININRIMSNFYGKFF